MTVDATGCMQAFVLVVDGSRARLGASKRMSRRRHRRHTFARRMILTALKLIIRMLGKSGSGQWRYRTTALDFAVRPLGRIRPVRSNALFPHLAEHKVTSYKVLVLGMKRLKLRTRSQCAVRQRRALCWLSVRQFLALSTRCSAPRSAIAAARYFSTQCLAPACSDGRPTGLNLRVLARLL